MEPLERERGNPWKLATLVIVGALVGAITSGIVVASIRDADPEPETAAVVTEQPPAVVTEQQPAVVAEQQPAVVAEQQAAVVAEQRPREDCSRYAVATHTDAKRVVKTGLLGTAVGAGLGAAGGAIVDGGDGAGKGAGIGALIGATGGTVYGLNEESKKKDAARRAYEDCLARNR
jgi:hypothetical protein